MLDILKNLITISSHNFLKGLHIISMVAWFSGLFYTGRLYVYYEEALRKEEPARKILTQQYEIMIRRLWFGITIPAMLTTLLFGMWMMIKFSLFKAGWLHIKLLCVLGLIIYVMYMGRLRKNLFSGNNKLSGFRLRVLNEVPLVFLILIVFIAYLKAFFTNIWSIFVLCVLTAFLFGIIIFIIKKNKNKISNT